METMRQQLTDRAGPLAVPRTHGRRRAVQPDRRRAARRPSWSARWSWTSSRGCCSPGGRGRASRPCAVPAARVTDARQVAELVACCWRGTRPGRSVTSRRCTRRRPGRDALPGPAGAGGAPARPDVGRRRLRLHRRDRRPVPAADSAARAGRRTAGRDGLQAGGARASCWCRCRGSSTPSACRWCATSSAAPAGTPGAARSTRRASWPPWSAPDGSTWWVSPWPATSSWTGARHDRRWSGAGRSTRPWSSWSGGPGFSANPALAARSAPTARR